MNGYEIICCIYCICVQHSKIECTARPLSPSSLCVCGSLRLPIVFVVLVARSAF